MNSPLLTLAKQRASQTIQLYFVIFIPMWVMFALNNTVFLALGIALE